jgi:F-type H+-transporting ATPase subunit b
MQFNESFWVAFSITLFGIFILKYIKKPLKELLANRADYISNKLNEAALLKNEASKILQESLRSYNYANAAAKDMLDLAAKEVASMRVASERELLDKINIKKNIALSKIQANEAKFLMEMRMRAVELTVSNSLKLLVEDGEEKVNYNLVKNSIDILSNNFNLNKK